MKDSFLKVLQSEGTKPYFTQILSSLQKAQDQNETVFPHQMDMFRPFEYFQLNETKVVILGQDPYHQIDQADGLAFSARYQDLNKTPKSLVNLFKNLKRDYPKTKIETNDLTNWAKQGVLLMNTVWTVSQNKAHSHEAFGWQNFTLKVLEEILTNNPKVIVVALGKPAQKLVKKLPIQPHYLINLSHPSPLSAHLSFNQFPLFKTINKYLKKENLNPIDWNLIKETKKGV
ncbi:uracil-DNA glycosylase [Mycoplasmopsis gallopavonis]|uniref:Uracil-DNA glycosylase n=1 Tax=Mycoplasmopsis gallopavonis TaxID=76629 RepID=A0A449AYW2_9BACT|nr:uracil-DNA glycosylase [Mycoplasmopsis gallopavonis]RIV16926.1 uracil-DNA glycosylase [Mycoplasmopsis gallopavonis]VEU72739.1 uracil-DNA glycosylase [Mycoplasmopsis gallopavonis]